MQHTQTSLLLMGLLSGLLILGGCANREEPATEKASPSPTVSPGVATPSPNPSSTAETKATAKGDLATAKSHLDQAARELKHKNDKGALDYIEMAHAEMNNAIGAEPAKDKAQLEAAIKELDSVRTMVEKHQKGAESSLAKVISKVEKLRKKV